MRPKRKETDQLGDSYERAFDTIWFGCTRAQLPQNNAYENDMNENEYKQRHLVVLDI